MQDAYDLDVVANGAAVDQVLLGHHAPHALVLRDWAADPSDLPNAHVPHGTRDRDAFQLFVLSSERSCSRARLTRLYTVFSGIFRITAISGAVSSSQYESSSAS